MRSLADGQRKVLRQKRLLRALRPQRPYFLLQKGHSVCGALRPRSAGGDGPLGACHRSGALSNTNGAAQFTVSDTGTAAYVSGATATNAAPIAWLDQSGKTQPLRSTPADWSSPSFSPDGSRLAMDISDGTQADVWVYDWARDTLSRLTFDKADDVAARLDSGRPRASSLRRSAETKACQNLFWQRADGTGDIQKLTDGPNAEVRRHRCTRAGNGSRTPNTRPGTGSDVMILPLQGDEATGWKPGTPTVFLSAPYTESSPMFSPDGRWIAYISNESGRNEIYVRPFPGPGGKWQISNGSADDPTWSLNKEGIDLRVRRQFPDHESVLLGGRRFVPGGQTGAMVCRDVCRPSASAEPRSRPSPGRPASRDRTRSDVREREGRQGGPDLQLLRRAESADREKVASVFRPDHHQAGLKTRRHVLRRRRHVLNSPQSNTTGRAPPVDTRFCWLHPRLGCDAFHEPLPPPCLSECPSCAMPVAALLVQLLHV